MIKYSYTKATKPEELSREVTRANLFLFWLQADSETMGKYSKQFREAFGRYLRGENPY